MKNQRIFLVAFADDHGSYAVAFSTREAAETYAVNIEGDDERGPARVIDTEIDQHLDLVEEVLDQTDSDPAADRGDWQFHRDHDQ